MNKKDYSPKNQRANVCWIAGTVFELNWATKVTSSSFFRFDHRSGPFFYYALAILPVYEGGINNEVVYDSSFLFERQSFYST